MLKRRRFWELSCLTGINDAEQNAATLEETAYDCYSQACRTRLSRRGLDSPPPPADGHFLGRADRLRRSCILINWEEEHGIKNSPQRGSSFAAVQAHVSIHHLLEPISQQSWPVLKGCERVDIWESLKDRLFVSWLLGRHTAIVSLASRLFPALQYSWLPPTRIPTLHQWSAQDQKRWNGHESLRISLYKTWVD